MKRALAILALLAATALCCFAGTTYTFSTLTESEGVKSATRTRVWTSNGSVKMLFVQSDEPSTPVSSYVLRPARASVVYLIYPDKKSYLTWDPGQALQRTTSNFQVLEPRFEKVSEGPGEPIAGFATTHYVFRLTYTMRSEMFGEETDTPVTVEQEYWVADDVRLGDIKAASLIGSQAPGLTRLGPDLQRTIEEQTSRLKGTPVKTVMTFITKLPGREQRTTMTSEISDVKRVVVPASVFRVPLGYKKTAMKLEDAEDDEHSH